MKYISQCGHSLSLTLSLSYILQSIFTALTVFLEAQPQPAVEVGAMGLLQACAETKVGELDVALTWKVRSQRASESESEREREREREIERER